MKNIVEASLSDAEIQKEIRILFTIPNLNTAGSGRALFKLLTRLDKTKFDIHVACLHSRGTLFQEFTEAGFTMHIIEYTHKMRPIFAGLRHCWKVAKWLKSERFGIVYSYHYSSDYSEPLAAKLAGCKWSFVKKNMSWSARAWKIRNFLADNIIVQNTEMQRTFYPRSMKTKLISIGVDTDEFFRLTERPDHLLPFAKSKNTKVIGVVANFVPVKGLDILIRAFGRICENEDVRLVLVGDCVQEYGEGLIRLVDELRIKRSLVHFVGKQRNVNEWLNTFDLFVQPTLAIGEGAPVSIQEAIAAGTLVIGSRVSGVEDQLSKTPELMFEPGSVESLADKLKDFLSLNETKIRLLREKQMRHLLANYTLIREVAAFEKFLLSLVH